MFKSFHCIDLLHSRLGLFQDILCCFSLCILLEAIVNGNVCQISFSICLSLIYRDFNVYFIYMFIGVHVYLHVYLMIFIFCHFAESVYVFQLFYGWFFDRIRISRVTLISSFRIWLHFFYPFFSSEDTSILLNITVQKRYARLVPDFKGNTLRFSRFTQCRS